MLIEGDGAEPGVQPGSAQGPHITQDTTTDEATLGTTSKLSGAAEPVQSGSAANVFDEGIPTKVEETPPDSPAMFHEVEDGEDCEGPIVFSRCPIPASGTAWPPPESVFTPEVLDYFYRRDIDPSLPLRLGARMLNAEWANTLLGRNDLPLGWYLGIPFGDPSDPRTYWRVRCIPPVMLNGSEVKDLAPAGKSVPVYTLTDDGHGEVVVVESVPKAWALKSIGVNAVGLSGTATTLAKGSEPRLNSSWEPVPLTDRKAISLMDSNALREDLAKQEARLVAGLGDRWADVRVARLPRPEKGEWRGREWGPDDFLAVRGAEALKEVLQDALPPIRERLAEEPTPYDVGFEMKPRQWLWKPWVPKGTVGLVVGEKGTRKSTYWADFASRLARGAPLMGEAGQETTPYTMAAIDRKPMNVLYLVGEGPKDSVRARIHAAGGHGPGKVYVVKGAYKLDSQGGWDELRRFIIRHDIGFVVVDPIGGYIHETDTNSDAVRAAVLNRAEHVAEETGCTIAMVRHLGKDSKRSIGDRIIGSVEWKNHVRWVIAHLKTKKPDVLSLRMEEANDGPKGVGILEYAGQVDTTTLTGWSIPTVWGPLAVEEEEDKPLVDRLIERSGKKLSSDRYEVAKALVAELEGKGKVPAAEVIKGVVAVVGGQPNVVQKVRGTLGLPYEKTGMGTVWWLPEDL